jgi:Protein of unknown function (DUF2798)
MRSTNNANIARKTSLLKATLMGLIMSSIISVAITFLNVYLLCRGSIICFQATFFTIWPRSFLVAFVLAIPLAFVVSPFVTRIADKIA